VLIAKMMADKAANVTPLNVVANWTMPGGTSGLFDTASSFSWAGKTRLPGEMPMSVQVDFDGVSQGDATTTNAAATAVQREDVGKDEVCKVGSRESGNCGTVTGSGLPYPANRVIAPIVRFTTR
jgi:hypothetical protein